MSVSPVPALVGSPLGMGRNNVLALEETNDRGLLPLLRPQPIRSILVQVPPQRNLMINNNNRDLFYVIALFTHHLPGKVDPRRGGTISKIVIMWPLK